MKHTLTVVALALFSAAGCNTTYDLDSPKIPGVGLVGVGHTQSCAVLGESEVTCWGQNEYMQLGAVQPTPEDFFVTLKLADATSIAGGEFHTCASFVDGTVKCWGRNDVGQLGKEPSDTTEGPFQVPKVEGAIKVSAGQSHACALLQTGKIKCWGANTNAQLGYGGDDETSPAVVVSGLTDAVDVAAGWNHTCAVLGSGSVQCWGNNQDGQLGAGDNGGNRGTPGAASDVNDATHVACGGSHTCVIRQSGQVMCWGNNGQRQIGLDLGQDVWFTPVAVTVPEISTAAQIVLGEEHSCVLLEDQTIACWGRNDSGQLGNGAPRTDVFPPPRLVGGLTNVLQIASGGNHTCAIRDTGEVFCWGYNEFGQVGEADLTNRTAPFEVPLIQPQNL